MRASLVLLLQMCGFEPAGFADAGDLLESSRLDEKFVFIDCAPGECSGLAGLEELRRRGWEGTAVVMTEREPPSDWVSPKGPVRLLVKPFSADDVLAIVRT